MITRIEMMILGDINNPEGWQMIGGSTPDLTEEQWLAVGTMICAKLGTGEMAQTFLQEHEDGTITAKRVMKKPDLKQ